VSRFVRHADKVAMTLLLACGGAGLGTAWSSLTSSAVVWQRPVRFAETAPPAAQSVDQFAAGRYWAQAAFDGGLRRCPQMNADFVAACEAEMKALKDRPAFAAGSYGGPLLITTYTPPERAVEAPPAPSIEEIESDAERSVVEHQPATVVPAAFEPTPENYPAAVPGAE
jgi:hypothetical protein